MSQSQKDKNNILPLIDLSGLTLYDQSRAYRETRRRAVDNPRKAVKSLFKMNKHIREEVEFDLTVGDIWFLA